ncbi:MAG: class I SAM-dependent methyltransferase, partial [Candidatus Omnitrophica bacterium]|nr:class I SAM-dependent methyltransferase [Candidatus Omnitrophota bacterium]
LKPGGLLVVQTPDTSSVLARFMKKRWPPFTPVEHIHLFSRKSLIGALEKIGFKDITVQKHRKVLTIKYVYEMLSTFGPEFQRLARPLYRFLPDGIKRCCLPFYIGEIVVIARKAND